MIEEKDEQSLTAIQSFRVAAQDCGWGCSSWTFSFYPRVRALACVATQFFGAQKNALRALRSMRIYNVSITNHESKEVYVIFSVAINRRRKRKRGDIQKTITPTKLHLQPVHWMQGRESTPLLREGSTLIPTDKVLIAYDLLIFISIPHTILISFFKYKIAYIIFVIQGLGSLLPWNAFISAADYFTDLYGSSFVFFLALVYPTRISFLYFMFIYILFTAESLL